MSEQYGCDPHSGSEDAGRNARAIRRICVQEFTGFQGLYRRMVVPLNGGLGFRSTCNPIGTKLSSAVVPE